MTDGGNVAFARTETLYLAALLIRVNERKISADETLRVAQEFLDSHASRNLRRSAQLRESLL